MKKTEFQTVKLNKGEMRVFERNGIKLHAYQTNDPIDNEVFVIENDGRAFLLEMVPFFENIKELEDYILKHEIKLEGIISSYHMAGASFMPQVPVYATFEAKNYGYSGGGKALIDGFTTAFGESFDNSLPSIEIIEGDAFKLADIEIEIIRNDDAFDVKIPALNVVYTHMLGHDCHSIVAGNEHADAIIEQLRDYISDGYDLILTSHYTPEDQKDAQAKIDYLTDLKSIAQDCNTAEEFKTCVQEKFPAYTGQNYLDMTCGFFFN